MKIIVTTSEELENIVRKVANDLFNELKQPAAKGDTQPGESAQPYVNKRQAAELLNCSPGTIDNFARSGRLRRHYVGRKAVRFERAEILALFSKKRNR